MQRRRSLWVVEFKFDDGVWQTTTYVGLTREEARREARMALAMNSGGGIRTRVRRYVAEGE